jgi:hypothetical protein
MDRSALAVRDGWWSATRRTDHRHCSESVHFANDSDAIEGDQRLRPDAEEGRSELTSLVLSAHHAVWSTYRWSTRTPLVPGRTG